MLDKLRMAVQSGLLAGSLVGVAEALWVLSSAGSAGDFVALFYATVLYGVVGAAMGVGVGVALAALSGLWRGLSDELAWVLGFIGVFVPLGMVISLDYADKVIYAEAGVQTSGGLTLLALFGVLALVALAVGPKVLSQTPLKVLRTVKGTAAAWGGLALVTAIFSFAPGDDPDGSVRPERAQGAALAERPDVLLIMVDALRADALGAYGAASQASPALDALAADGVVFERAHAQASWTRPSFATVFTSMVPSRHEAALTSSRLPDEVDTLAEVLAAGGYVTGGLPNSAHVTRSFNFQQGFDTFHYMAPELPFWATESVSQLSLYAALREVGEALKSDDEQVTDFYQPAETVIGAAKGFIEAQGEARWFLMMHLMEPHEPYFERPYSGMGYSRAEHEAPEAEEVEHLRELYAGEIAGMDAELGVMLSWLKESGRYDDVLIIVTADHGEELYDHGGWWHGASLYEEQLHVPLIVKLPGQALAGTRAPWLVRHLDLAPTIAAAGGVAPSPQWQGADLFDDAAWAMLGPASVEAPVEAPVAEGEEPGEAAPARDPRSLDRPVLAEQDFEGKQLVAIIQGDWKLIRANEGNPRGLESEELYDLQFDAGEQMNVASGNGQRVTELADSSRKAVQAARSGGVEGQEAEVNEADEERLRALGYLE